MMEFQNAGSAQLEHPHVPEPVEKESARRFIYIAGPCTPMGGGMYTIAEYLVESEKEVKNATSFRLLETRGPGAALLSPFYLLRAVGSIVLGRLTAQLPGIYTSLSRLSRIWCGLSFPYPVLHRPGSALVGFPGS